MADQVTPEQGDPLIGMAVSGFIVSRKLAQGGMGAVYLADHERLPLQKVIKVLLPAYARNPYVRQRFEREAEAASRLQHDHILKIDNFGALPDGQLWLMTEFLQGQPLDEFLRTRGRLAEHRALLVLLQLCSALEHAHRFGIIHRDLKPGNVFVCPTKAQPFAVKLLDFGIAKLVDASSGDVSTQSGVPIGTPSYMAVEQYDQADTVTPQADIFSLGVMTCEMVTGRLPWGCHDKAVIYHKQRMEQPVLDGLSPGWRRVVQEALAVEPKYRPESARAYAVALASEIPAITPYVPSGAEMLRTVAPDLMTGAPDNSTVRNQSNRDLVAPMSWSTLTPPETPPPTTTIGASAGVIVAKPQRPLARSKLILAGIGACGLAGGLSFAVVRSHGAPASSPDTVPISLPRPPISTATSAPEAAPPAPSAAARPPGTTVPVVVQPGPAIASPGAAPANPPPAGPRIQSTERNLAATSPGGLPRPRGAIEPPPIARTRPAAESVQRTSPGPPARRPRPEDPRGTTTHSADEDTFDPDSPTGR